MSDDTQFEQPAIAIVGMAGRFPGAENPDELWTLLREGKEGATDFNVNELHGSESSSLIDSPSYVRRRGVVAHAEDFDAGFFGVRPLEARVMDPQQRVFLEICHEALESAGCVPESFSGSIGVYATASENSFVERCLGGDPQLREAAGPVAVRIGNDIDYLASGVAYRLNLSGPAITVRTACSSSLVAIINGCRSLHEFECDAVLAGGVSISAPQNTGYLHQPGSILSPDGHCRTFDQNAKGTYFSNGAAVVLLKRFEDAIADGDNVLAKIVGFAVNNDGANRASFTSPNVMGQAEVIAMAQEMGEVDPSSISYIEAHGTATEVGDPIEVEALTMAFRRKTQETQFCGIGSIKSNLG
ncbi:MAG: polyketide synthase, partial [Gammaproteobacteria bacterium]|nr:polyketide synthase [Gammaproteobacteria bacterium]